MNGDVDDIDDMEPDDDSVSEDLVDEEVVSVLDDDNIDDDVVGDNIGDMSVEINVEELVAKIEATDSGEAAEKRSVRVKLDEVHEQRGSDLDSTYEFDLDEDL